MPRKREYIDRLPRAIELLRRLKPGNALPGAFPAHLLVNGVFDLVTRKTIESAFGVRRWSALRILGQCERMGAARLEIGGAMLYRREEIISALERLRAGETPEIGRRRRLGKSLEPAARDARLRGIEISPAGPASDRIRSTVELPAGITVAPGRLTIEFAGRGDFLALVGSLVFALQNDFEGVMSLVSEV